MPMNNDKTNYLNIISQDDTVLQDIKILTNRGKTIIETKFLADTGSIADVASGNYVSRQLWNTLVKGGGVRITKDKPIIIMSGGQHKHKVTQSMELRMACADATGHEREINIKVYLFEELNVELVIGRKSLLANNWIRSDVLKGFNTNTSVSIDRLMMINDDSERVRATLDTSELWGNGDLKEEDDGHHGSIEEIEYGIHDVDDFKRISKEYSYVFSKELLAQPANLPPYKIDINDIDREKWNKGREPSQPRTQSHVKDMAMKKDLDKKRDTNIIEISMARRTSPAFMVPKPKAIDEHRKVVDYSELNALIGKPSFTIPRIAYLYSTLASLCAMFFSIFDLTAGFHQVVMSEESKVLTAFKVMQGVFQYKRMPMGIKGAPQWFQGVITEAFGSLVMRAISGILIYIDDIIVYSTTLEGHKEVIKEVLEVCKAKNICLKPNKSRLCVQSLEYLGGLLSYDSEKKLMIHKVKTEKIKELFDFPEPVYGRQMKSFIGLITQMHTRIPKYAELIGKLTIDNYTKKKAMERYVWDDEKREAFRKAKELVMNAPSLGLLNPKNDIRLETDASDYGLGARLYERSIKRDEMVDGVRVIEYGPEVDIMYISHSFRANEIAWPIADKECYAIVYAVEKLDFIIDQVPITVLTDHKNLIRIQESKNKRVQLWKQKLLRQIITYEFIAGKDNIYADAFSRIVEISDSDKDHIEEIEHFNMINDIINEDKYGLFALSKKERLNSYSKEQEGEYTPYDILECIKLSESDDLLNQMYEISDDNATVSGEILKMIKIKPIMKPTTRRFGNLTIWSQIDCFIQRYLILQIQLIY
jgi:hypothetical protein